MAFTTGCRGVSALAPGAPLPPPSAATLVSAALFLSHILSLFSHTCCALFTLSLICYHRGTHQHHSQAQLGQQKVCLGAGQNWLSPTWGQLLVSSHRSPEHSCYQTLPHKPNRVTHIITQKQKQNLFQVIKSNIRITALGFLTDSWLSTQVKNSMTKAQ